MPVEQVVVYRAGSLTSPAYVNAVINSNINPLQLWYYSGANIVRCTNGPRCFTAGDWFRPAMNTSTVASVPIVVQSPTYLGDPTNNINDLAQTFIHDPQIGKSQPLGLKVQPFATGANLTAPGALDPALLAQIAAGLATFSVSSMVYASHHTK